ncbi:zinc finger C2HC domain-containing protein 1A-like isoform X3 [Drosophila novamexicana]|uniref:zinc finger C2HC domain-containing protein 1A-like isoform X3 n=1 Tax=Drosophila novamexicana TaxID=47314 RepID=UPI0011E5C71D|nr:zinc finger C2HC domain-containing protein 1A-like isoform X3 [Drosophila novamexicana]
MYLQNICSRLKTITHKMTSNLTGTTRTPSEAELKQCPHCNRTFNPKVLTKHAAICGNVLRKRQVFDSSRQRREGIEYFSFGTHNSELPLDAARGQTSPQSKTKLTRATLKQTLDAPTPKAKDVASPCKPESPASAKRKATATASGTAANVPGTSSSMNRDCTLTKRSANVALERCPHCERSFNLKAYDSHVAWCKEKAVIAAFTVGCSNEDTMNAKKRMDARIKYKPPALKLTMNNKLAETRHCTNYETMHRHNESHYKVFPKESAKDSIKMLQPQSFYGKLVSARKPDEHHVCISLISFSCSVCTVNTLKADTQN